MQGELDFWRSLVSSDQPDKPSFTASLSFMKSESSIETSIHKGYDNHLRAFSIEQLIEKKDFLSAKLA